MTRRVEMDCSSSQEQKQVFPFPSLSRNTEGQQGPSCKKERKDGLTRQPGRRLWQPEERSLGGEGRLKAE